MLVHFYIKFSSKYGESLQINFPSEVAGDIPLTFPLAYLDDEFWHISISSAALPNQELLTYSVIFQAENGDVTELIYNRKVNLAKVKAEVLNVFDGPTEFELYQKVFDTAPFKVILKNQKQKSKKHTDKDPDVIFKVQVPPLGDGKVVCITGSSKKFKEWNEQKPLHL